MRPPAPPNGARARASGVLSLLRDGDPMHDTCPAPGASAPAATATPGDPAAFAAGWRTSAGGVERARLIERARHSGAARQLQRCCPTWRRLLEQLSWRALTKLAADHPVDPNDPASWHSPDHHAQVVLRRHGLTAVRADRAHPAGHAGADRRASPGRPRRRPGLDAR